MYFRSWWPTKVEQIAGIVSKFELSQNYPNPFNPSTTIEFSIAKRSNVRLVIYDITGRIVRTLIDGQEFEPGLYRVQWNGKNDYGEYVASGIYIYRLRAGSFIATRKMVLAR
jgi:flagellar hook assembly protein FlgD